MMEAGFPLTAQPLKKKVPDNRFQRSELNYLIYKDPLAYADLILNSKLNVLFE